jgi:hypothetical protein
VVTAERLIAPIKRSESSALIILMNEVKVIGGLLKESRVRENFMHGLMRGCQKQSDGRLE